MFARFGDWGLGEEVVLDVYTHFLRTLTGDNPISSFADPHESSAAMALRLRSEVGRLTKTNDYLQRKLVNVTHTVDALRKVGDEAAVYCACMS